MRHSRLVLLSLALLNMPLMADACYSKMISSHSPGKKLAMPVFPVPGIPQAAPSIIILNDAGETVVLKRPEGRPAVQDESLKLRAIEEILRD